MQCLECVSAALENMPVQSDVKAVLPASLKDVCISTHTLPRPEKYSLIPTSDSRVRSPCSSLRR